MRTYVFANQKGGVGKSTVAVHKAIYHESLGQRVLFIDFDGQGNSTTTLRARARISANAIDLFGSDPLPSLESAPGITLLQGTKELNEIERLPNNVILNPKEAIAKYVDRFDVCIIDTPPTMGLRLLAALTMSDFAITPFELAGYSIQGIAQIIETIKGVQGNLNPDLVFLGMLPNKVNSRSGSHREAMAQLLSHYKQYIIRARIVNRVAIQDATDQGLAVWELKSSSAREAAAEMKQALESIDKLVAERAAA